MSYIITGERALNFHVLHYLPTVAYLDFDDEGGGQWGGQDKNERGLVWGGKGKDTRWPGHP